MTLNFPKRLVINGTEWNKHPLTFDVCTINGGKVEPTWQDIILHGTTALTLVNAKADSLEYLKLFGGTEQLPETYLDTVTLSGGCEQRNLPSGYTQVEYLEVATINAYFSTGINATIDTDIGITASNVTSNSSQLLVAECGSGGDYFRIAKAGASQRVIGTLGPSTVTDNNTEGIDKFTARLNKSGFYVDGSLIGTFSDIPSSLTDVGEIDIFRGVYSTSASSAIYYAYLGTRFHRAWVDDNIFLPCRRNSDNQLGIYNTKTREFILPSGEGTFIAGADVTTPSPDTPMDIVCNNGAIKVSRNLFNRATVTNGYYISATGEIVANEASMYSDYIEVQPNTTYIISLVVGSSRNAVRVHDYTSNKTWISQLAERVTGEVDSYYSKTFTTSSNAKYIRFGCRQAQENIQIEQGSTPTTYMPYGQIYVDGTQEVVTDSLGNTANAERLLAVGTYKDTQEVIAGSVTRNVGIKVLDGTEEWVASSTADLYSLDGLDGYDSAVYQNGVVLCTHFVGVLPTVSGANMPNYSLRAGGASTSSEAVRRTIYIKYVGLSSLTDFKQFLANQYAQGTPVIIVYPTSSATTSTVSGQFLSKSPVTQTAGAISGLTITTTESAHTTPTPQQPLPINCNNGVVKVSPNLFNKNATYLNAFVNADTGILTGANVGQRSFCVACQPNTTYVISGYGASTWGAFTNNTIGTTSTSRASGNNSTITTGTNDKYLIGLAYVTEKTTDYRDTLQLEQGSTATPYKPYGSIYVDGTTETVGIAGKNLWSNDITFTSGSLNANTGQPTASSISHYTSAIPVKIGETYTFSLLDGVESGVIQSYKRIMGYSSTNTTDFIQQMAFIDMTGKQGQKENATFTIPAGVNYIRVSCGLIDSEYQLELGSTATTYEPYFNGGNATAENLFKVGTYQDVQSVIDGGVTRNVGVKVLDGTESWSRESQYSRFYINLIPLSIVQSTTRSIPAYCTHFKMLSNGEPFADITSGQGYIIRSGSQGSASVLYFHSDITTVASFKQFLAQQYNAGTPVVLLYPLDTATTETVTAQPMDIQAGSNIVQITQASMDDLELEVKYKAGVSVTITEIENAQLDDSVTVTIS